MLELRSIFPPLSAHSHLFSLHSLFRTQQVIYMGVVLYVPSLALNAGEESQPWAPNPCRLGGSSRGECAEENLTLA